MILDIQHTYIRVRTWHLHAHHVRNFEKMLKKKKKKLFPIFYLKSITITSKTHYNIFYTLIKSRERRERVEGETLFCIKLTTFFV